MIRKKLAKLKPNDDKIAWVALYTITTTLLTFSIIGIKRHLICWAMLPLVTASSLLIYYAFIPKNKIPNWIIVQYWLTNLLFYLLANVLWYELNIDDPKLMLILFLVYSNIILWTLPFYLSIGCIALISIYYIVSMRSSIQLWPLDNLVLYVQLGLILLFFIIVIQNKLEKSAYTRNNPALKDPQKFIRNPEWGSIVDKFLNRNSTMLEHLLQDVTASIAFLDSNPLYIQDLKLIVNRFNDWSLFLKRQARSKDHMLILPTEITIDTLIDKTKIALEKEIEKWCVPRLLVKKANAHIPNKILCDINQLTQLLVTAILRIIDTDSFKKQYIRITLHNTKLQYQLNNLMQDGMRSSIKFPAIAMVISNTTTHPVALPKVRSCYKHITRDHFCKRNQSISEYLDFNIRTIENIVHAHYGYLAIPNRCALLLVVPCHVTNIHNKMLAHLPTTSKTSITVEEKNASIRILKEFHTYVCETSYVNSAIISSILLLLRRCYGFKYHLSGQLLYVRAIGIAELVSTWLLHFPRPIYAALLYDVVRYSSLPLAYIKANYEPSIFYTVMQVLRINKPSILKKILLDVDNCPHNDYKQLMVSGLYIKLAERIYDLRHAAGYTDLVALKHMAQEAFAIDIELAKQLEEPKIVTALTDAAQKALEICEEK